ncbi:MAG: hypothetical protein PHT94_04785 [Candidatus Nanoarchaeia archaeon]|nr:hypothetical protein [Candidatus Nanoarchaeia archaeon]
MSIIIKKQNTKHSPTLNTVIMVEEVLKQSENSVITIAELKKKLPKQVNHNVLKTILIYLEVSNKIAVSISGITWIFNTNLKLQDEIEKGFEL